MATTRRWRLVAWMATAVLIYAILSAPKSVQIGWFLLQGVMGVTLFVLLRRDHRRTENGSYQEDNNADS